MDDPAPWKCVYNKFIYAYGTEEYCKTTNLREIVSCRWRIVEISFENHATYVDQRTFDQVELGVEPAKYRLTKGKLVIASGWENQ